MNTQEPPEGAGCPRSHRVLRKTMCGTMRLMVFLVVASLIYLAYTSW